MSKKKAKKPFKVILDAPAFREKMCELTSDELKVWMYFWTRTNGEGTAFPGNDTLSKELGIYLGGIKNAKKGLRAKGWLSSNGQRVRPDGTKSTVLESVHTPWVGKQSNRGSESDPDMGRKAAHETVGRNTDVGKTTQQKEYSINPEGMPSAYSEKTLEVSSESVSELVSESSLSTPQVEAAKAEAVLSEEARTILKQIYPVVRPELSGVDADNLNRIAAQQSVGEWLDFFEWHKTHKPDNLRYRDLKRFFEGVDYSLNNRADHDANTCKVCNPVKSKSETAAEPKNPSCSFCKGSTYGNPTWENGKPFCGDCMKFPAYRRESGQHNIMGHGEELEEFILRQQAKAQAVGGFDPEEA